MALKYIKVPNLGESVTEATISEWLVSPGDRVKRYDPLLEAQSDKVVTEIPSDYEGVVKEILVEADETVPIGTEILVIEVEGEDSDTAQTEEVNEVEDKVEEEEVTKKAITPKKETRGADTPRYSPAVVRIAQERGISLDDVPGTGKGGRITRKDVLAFDPSTAPVKEKVTTETTSDPVKEVDEKETTSTQTQQSSTIETTDRQVVVPADGIRKAIASKMVQSKSEIPHAWMMVEADVTNIVRLRNEVKDNFKEQEGITLSFFPFFVKAVAQALKKNPLLNSSWDNGNIIMHKDINISIAVATEDHLFVPVIKNADQYSITGIAKEIDRLATDVRNGRLKNDDMVGGTITVNNTGPLGSIQSMGIINHPQAAILQVETIQEKIVPTTDGFKTASMINLSLSMDHRILDGFQAGRFLKDVKENLAFYQEEASIY